MPTITVDLSDLNRLLGENYTLEELRQHLQELGIEVEGITKEGLKLEVHHNRPDLFGVEGVARSLKGYLGIETGAPDYELGDPKIKLEVDSSIKGTRPVVVMGHIEDAEFDDIALKALMDLQEKLHQVLGRDRRKISIGAYDLEGMKMPIHYTTTPPDGEGFIPLEFDEKLSPEKILEEHPKGRRYSHLLEDFDRYPLLVDSEDEVLSMPPVINSEPRKVTVNSKNIGLDVTGVDEGVAREALRVIMCAVAERGFSIRAVDVEYSNRKFRAPSLEGKERSFNLSRANRELGLELGSKEASEMIERMRYEVLNEEDGNIRVKVPPYRSDLMHEVDLFEDLAVGYGYNNLEPCLPDLETSGEPHPAKEIGKKAREILTGFGFIEVMPFMLTSRELNFDLMQIEGEAVTIENPVSEEYSIVRTWLLPGLMDVLRENRQHELPQRIFEVDEVLLLDEDAETGAKNVLRAAGAVIGEDANFSYVRAVAEALFRELRVDWTVESYDHPSFLNGRSAEFLVSGESWGFVGEIHPQVILNFELEHPVAAFEVNLPR